MKEYDIGVIIGRFNPFHKGHEHLINQAMSRCENLIICIGSANRARSEYNPFTFSERKAMIMANYPCPLPVNSINFVPINDHFYNDTLWVKSIQDAIKKESASLISENNNKVALFGHDKDASTFYLKMFPEWDYVDVPLLPEYANLSATTVRNYIFTNNSYFMNCIPVKALTYMIQSMVSPDFEWLKNEAQSQLDYRKSWEASPFKPTFVTVDCLVEQMGHILLVERKKHPGKGLLALPGGFIDQDHKLIDNAVRELKEETKISDWKGEIPAGRLKSFVIDQKVFDHPLRSPRGRTITHLFHFRLPSATDLYKVTGADDAEKAFWYKLADIDARMMFEDHADAIEATLGVIL